MSVLNRTKKETRQGGYCSLSNLMILIHHIATGQWHEGDQITAKMLLDLGIHRSEIYLVRAAARNLLLLDSDNRITDTLVQLAHASKEDKGKYQDILKECIWYAYPDIVRLDFAHFTSREMKQAFIAGNYEPNAVSLLPKVIALFRGLCSEAGLIADENMIDEDRTPQEFSEHVDQETSTSDTLEVVEGTPLMVELPSNSQMNGSLSTTDYSEAEEIGKFLMSLFELPKKPGWTEEDRTWWRLAVSSKAEKIAQLTKEHGRMKQ